MILERVGEVAYRLTLPPRLSNVHDVSYVYMLCKCEPDPSHVLSVYDVDIHDQVSYVGEHIRSLDRREQGLRDKCIPLVKVL